MVNILGPMDSVASAHLSSALIVGKQPEVMCEWSRLCYNVISTKPDDRPLDHTFLVSAFHQQKV